MFQISNLWNSTLWLRMDTLIRQFFATGKTAQGACNEYDVTDVITNPLLPNPKRTPYSSAEDQPRGRKCKWCKYSIFAWVLSASLLASIILVTRPPHSRQKPNFSSKGWIVDVHESSPSKTNAKIHLCGNSSEEARRLGCRFDQLTWSWLPPNCPSYANDEFMASAEKPWVFYEDVEATKVVGNDAWQEVLDGELGVFGERREHVTHCVFMFLSLAQIVRDKTPYHEKYADYEHSKHCAQMLLDIVKKSEDWDDLNTYSGTVFFDQSCS